MRVPAEEATAESGIAENSLKTLIARLIPFLASTFVTVIGKTVRLKVLGEDMLREAMKKKGNVIFAFWHNRMLLLTYTHRHRGINVMVSRSRDGEYISRVIERLGFRPIRGSTTSGGDSALRMIAKRLLNGADVAITPDGPQGPRYHAKMGVIHLAMTTGYPIVPVSCCSDRKWILNSWDRFIVPRPFARAILIYGSPISVAQDSDAESKRRELEEELTRITEEAEKGT